jgi:hypothetical protein
MKENANTATSWRKPMEVYSMCAFVTSNPGSSPGQAAHFSHHVTFGAQRGTVTDKAQSLIYIAL